MFSVVRGGFKPLDNFAATTPPGVGNDITQGYSVGSQWFNTSTGVRWFCRDASSGAAVWVPDSAHPGYITTRLYTLFAGNTATNNVSAGVIYAQPFTPAADMTLAQAEAWLVVGSAATGIKGAFYANKYSGTGKAQPNGAPISADNTGVATTGSSVTVVLPLTGSLKKGITYWFCVKVDSAVPTFSCNGTTSADMGPVIGRSSVAATTIAACKSYTHAYATAWPTFDGTESWTDATVFPVINLKA